MNIRYIGTGLLLMLLSLFACEKESGSLQTTGYIELGVSKNVEVITRAVDVETQSLAVDICTGANDSVVKHFTDYNDMAGERVLLNVGTYKVKVSSNPIKKLDFEKPTFYGESDKVTVKAGETTPVSVECKLSCVKVTTKFTKPVQEKFASCVARVSNESGYLDYTMTETRAGYFQPGYLLVNLTLTNKEGLTFKMSKLIEEVEARDHYCLVFDLIASGDNNSGMDFDVTIETDPTNDEEHTVTVPLPETGYEQEPPVIVADGDWKEGTLSFDKGDVKTGLVKITSENIGLESVRLLATSSLFEENKVSSSLDLLNLSEEEKTVLSEIGLVVPVLDDKKQPLDLDFSTLISKLQGGTHTFVLVARDLMGHETSQTFVVTVNSPVTTHEVVSAEVWAHYATLRGYIKNATEADVADYKFQYKKATDESWTDCPTPVIVLATPDAKGSNVTQILTHLEDNTTYEYRLVNGDAVAEKVKFTTEKVEALKNGDFEDDANGPWNTNSSSYWSSGNNTFVSDLCKSYNEGNNTMALLKSTYAVIKFAAGNAFTGSFKMDGMDGIVTLGKPFTSRPSSFKGIYNYVPKKVTDGGNKISKDVLDQCAIYIILLTDPIELKTKDQATLDWKTYYKEKIVGFAELPTETDMTTSGYESFDLKIEYTKDVAPKYIGVLATSSKYGDYFEGGRDSELRIDDFELVYDQAPVSE